MNAETAATNKIIVPTDVNLSVSPFGQNRSAEIAYKKTERLALATHLVTNFVPENEYVRENVRVRTQMLLDSVLDLREGLRSAGPDKISDIAAEVRRILSLLDIVHATGYISDMNLDVLKGAFADLVNFLRTSEDGEAAESLELGAEYFMPARQYKGQITKGQKRLTDTIITDKKETKMSDRNDVSGTRKRKPRRPSVHIKKVGVRRRSAVLDVVSKQGSVFLTDILKAIPSWSGKTIQRELNALVADGVLAKEGVKRWTKYSLAI